MYATVQKWGNSQGLRIPKVLLDAIGIGENDRVELIQIDDSISIRKASPVKHRSLEERLTAFYGKPLEEIGRISDDPEFDWGAPKGSEVW
ncbi:MAG: AbrB/MazE/SpoVT family DNA-binding domain-containing protein [Firmicutes bacterium]|nr:AbrB/MazE/SpoVT family DNA-binding domain-containing protein [Bacillota bacterium]